MPAPFFPSEPLHPPYGVTQPRTLVRWDDVNSQNGPLTRVRGFIVIPAFSAGNNYTNPIQPSIARRVAQINYTVISNKPFSIVDLTPFTGQTVNVGWTITIAWATANQPENIVTRYILFSNGSLDFNVVGALATFPWYTGQPIPSVFCIEIWDMGVGVYANGIVTPQSINIFTSILGNSDYRYAVDFNVANTNTIVPQSINGPVYNFPINFNAIVPVGITPSNLPKYKYLSDENLDILKNEAGSLLIN